MNDTLIRQPKLSMSLQPPDLIPCDYRDRLQLVIDESWRIFQSHFINRRHPILKEAPFQHHFANIISTVGSLYCVSREDRFFVDLECKCLIAGKNKFLDIACSFTADSQVKAKCAIELKFKTALQGAQDHGRIDAYVDVANLEYVCETEYDFGRFYMITDSSVYINKSVKGVGTRFCTHHGYQVQPGQMLKSESKGREGIEVILGGSYHFNWTNLDKWHFLELKVNEI